MSTIQSISQTSSVGASKAAQQNTSQEAAFSVQSSSSGNGTSDSTEKLHVEEIARPSEKNSMQADTPEQQEANTRDALKRAVEEINKNAANSEAQFAVHEKTNRIMVKIVDKRTKEVIKEFPPEKTLDMIAKAWELAGLTIDERR